MKEGCDEAAGSEGLIEHSVSWVWICREEVKSYGDSCKKKFPSITGRT